MFSDINQVIEYLLDMCNLFRIWNHLKNWTWEGKKARGREKYWWSWIDKAQWWRVSEGLVSACSFRAILCGNSTGYRDNCLNESIPYDLLDENWATGPSGWQTLRGGTKPEVSGANLQRKRCFRKEMCDQKGSPGVLTDGDSWRPYYCPARKQEKKELYVPWSEMV